MNTKRVGEISELYITARFLELGYNVSKPIGDNCRYDLLIEKDNQIKRIQCKTAYFRKNTKNCITFKTCSIHCRNFIHSDYKNQVDYFAVYFPNNKKVYFINIKDTGSSNFNIRLDKPSKHFKTMNYAEKYEL